jgi:DNA invertase Pin-like site-specific DNA recombinase
MARKALGYARVSGKSQEIDGTGLDEQVAQITAWAASNGYEIVGWFKDAITGELSWNERPGMKALVERLALNGVEAIIVHQMDRIARGKSGIFEDFYAVAETANVAVISVVDGVLTDVAGDEFKSADSEMIRTIKQAIVRQEKRKLVARMALGKARCRATGNWREGRLPYGSHPAYPEEKAALARIVVLAESGCSLRAIARTLDAEGYKPRKAVKWSGVSIAAILERREKQ